MKVEKILNYFGYIKPPLAAVKLSMELESKWEVVIDVIGSKNPEIKKELSIYLKMQKSITDFLRSGRHLNN